MANPILQNVGCKSTQRYKERKQFTTRMGDYIKEKGL